MFPALELLQDEVDAMFQLITTSQAGLKVVPVVRYELNDGLQIRVSTGRMPLVLISVGASLWDWWTGTFGSGRLIWDESRWSFSEASVKDALRRATYYGLKLNFHRYIGQLRRHHRLTRRRLGVHSSFTSGVRVRTTTTCTPSATIRTSRRTVVVQRHGRRRTVLLVCNKVTNDDRTVV